MQRKTSFFCNTMHFFQFLCIRSIDLTTIVRFNIGCGFEKDIAGGTIYYGKKSDNRKRIQDDFIFCASLSILLFFTDIIWYGGSVHHRTVQRNGKHDRCRKWQSGHAHADRHDCRSGDGFHRHDRSRRRCQTQGGNRKNCWKLRDLVHGIFHLLNDRFVAACKTDRIADSDSDRGDRRFDPVPDNLLYRNSVYYSIQYHRFDLPWYGRFEKSDVFYRDRLRSKYRA